MSQVRAGRTGERCYFLNLFAGAVVNKEANRGLRGELHAQTLGRGEAWHSVKLKSSP